MGEIDTGFYNFWGSSLVLHLLLEVQRLNIYRVVFQFFTAFCTRASQTLGCLEYK